MPYKQLFIAWLAAGLFGCQTVAQDYDQPARIVEPDAASRAELQRVVNGIFGMDVPLSDSALTDSSVLTLERNPRAAADYPAAQGRILESPIQFRLVINGADCILIDQRDRSRHVLANTTCEAE